MKLELDPMAFSCRDRGDGYINVTYRGYILPDLGVSLSRPGFYLLRRHVVRLHADHLRLRFEAMSAHRQIELLRLINHPPRQAIQRVRDSRPPSSTRSDATNP
jgi:hypothetical protein